MEQYDTIIIGAGPAGLFCAIHAAGPDNRVLLLEKNRQPGIKLMLSGSGQCNLTHEGDIRTFFSRYGAHGQFVRPSLLACTNQDLIRFFQDRGLPLETTEGGKIFPVSRRAGDVCDILVRECRELGVEIRYGEPLHQVEVKPPYFILDSSQETLHARNIVIATGGASYPKTGSAGDGYRMATSLGHPITEVGPALTPVIVQDFVFAGLAGLSFYGIPFSVWRDGRKVFQKNGDILFTHTGLSGPGILDSSRDIRPGDVIRLSLSGTSDRDGLARRFAGIIAKNPVRAVKSLVAETGIPDRLAGVITAQAGIPRECTGAHLTAAGRSLLLDLLTGFPLTVTDLGGLSVAMVTRGGIALEEVNAKTMESRIVPGLFFAGEVLDIDGDTGGFNIQAAFSTGYCAAQGIRNRRGR